MKHKICVGVFLFCAASFSVRAQLALNFLSDSNALNTEAVIINRPVKVYLYPTAKSKSVFTITDISSVYFVYLLSDKKKNGWYPISIKGITPFDTYLNQFVWNKNGWVSGTNVKIPDEKNKSIVADIDKFFAEDGTKPLPSDLDSDDGWLAFIWNWKPKTKTFDIYKIHPKKVTRNKKYVEFWLKETNTANQEYRLDLYAGNCVRKFMGLKMSVKYNETGEVIFSEEYKSSLERVIPDSQSEEWLTKACLVKVMRSSK